MTSIPLRQTHPLLQRWEKEHGESYRSIGTRLVNTRLEAAELWSWGIPNEEALDAIKKYSPIIEVGAGLGYWARLLKQIGVDIIATDSSPPLIPERWAEVGEDDPSIFLAFPERTLFMCWVPSVAAFKTAKIYKGRVILWVGEPTTFPGYHLIETIKIPQWSGIKDALLVFKKTESEVSK